jgi:hypothetical protein
VGCGPNGRGAYELRNKSDDRASWAGKGTSLKGELLGNSEEQEGERSRTKGERDPGVHCAAIDGGWVKTYGPVSPHWRIEMIMLSLCLE